MDAHRLDAVLFPAMAGASIAAKAGYPSVQVPAGFVSGVRDKETPDYPYGATFTGRAWSEQTLLRLAYAFEQATQARRPPACRRSTRPARRSHAQAGSKELTSRPLECSSSETEDHPRSDALTDKPSCPGQI
jgi:hypothetical protein